MPAPTTNAEFLELVRKSGVVDDKRLDAYLEKLRTAGSTPATPGQLAGLFVHDGLLTLFQAEQIVKHGKWRRFTIGKYKVLEQLGAGGMGSVYLCEHMLMRRRVAVKVLPKSKAEEQSALDRFYREARAVAALDHPNIVRAYDIDNADNLHFLVMEYVDGSNLQEIVKRSGPMDPIRAAHYIRQAALGLQHAHEQARLVHRDIKPGNILVDRNGIIKILDMGLARFFHDEEDDLTKKHDENVLGTADYLAPEQAIDSHGVDIRADIYSLGATFYFCIAGKTPFAEGTVAQKLIWHQTRQPKPLKSIRPDVDDGIVAVIDHMMVKDPNQRYQTPLEVVEALSPWTKTSIAPPSDVEMPKLSLAAMGNPSVMAPSMVGGEGLPSSTRSSSGTATPGPKPAWQVPTPPNLPSSAPATVRTATPPARPASPPAPAARPSTPPAPAPAPVAQSAPAPAPVAAVPRPTAPVAVQIAPAPPRPAPSPVKDQAPAWEAAPAPNADATEQLDTAPRSTRRRTRESQKKEAARKRLILIIIAIAGALLIGVASFFIWRALSTEDKSSTPSPVVKREPMTFYAGKDAEWPTLLVLVQTGKLRPGDHVVVPNEITDELKIDTRDAFLIKGVTIEADEKKPEVLWKPRKNSAKASALIMLTDVEDVTIKGFTFDGKGEKGQADNLIQLTCGCRNVRLENIKLRNFLETGLRFSNCMATREAPVIVTGAQFADNPKPPILFELKEFFYKLYPANDNIIIRDDCTIPAAPPIQIQTVKKGDYDGVKLPMGRQAQILPVEFPKK
jgi:serine/threonine protein kinase